MQLASKQLVLQQIQEDRSYKWPRREQLSGVRTQVMLWLWGVGAVSNSLAPPWDEEGRQRVRGMRVPRKEGSTLFRQHLEDTPWVVFCRLQELASSGRGGLIY